MRLGALPADAKLLYTHESLTLAEVIRLVNKYSSNSMARTLFLTLGAERIRAVRRTTAAGREAVQDFLARAAASSIPELVLENGSGLSRNERISAQGLADVLLAPTAASTCRSSPRRCRCRRRTARCKRRFRSPEMQGRLRMKTGTLEDVTALAGYVNAASGRTFVTVVILNHPSARRRAPARPIQTALVQWVFGQ